MSNSILESLYYGRINPRERCVVHSSEHKDLTQKIESEKRHFIEKMSLNDVQRFEALENLYIRAGEDEAIALFSHGFKLGARIMLEILGGRDSSTDD